MPVSGVKESHKFSVSGRMEPNHQSRKTAYRLPTQDTFGGNFTNYFQFSSTKSGANGFTNRTPSSVEPEAKSSLKMAGI